MKCYFHDDVEAVAVCQRCGKYLCKSCASRYNPCSCDECYDIEFREHEDFKMKKKKEALIDTIGEFGKAIVKGIIVTFILTLIFNSMGNDSIPISISLSFFFIPFGWTMITYLEQWLPVFFMSGIAFIIYLTFKAVLSMILGIPCFLYQFIKFMIKIIRTR